MTSDVCCKIIQKVCKGEVEGIIKNSPALGLNGDIKIEGDSENGGEMNPEGASGDINTDDIELNNGSFTL